MIKYRDKFSSDFSLRKRKIDIYFYSAVVGVFAGLVIVAYRLSITFFENLRLKYSPLILTSYPLLAIWLLISIFCGIIVALLIKFAPLIKGSGIPQIKAALLRKVALNWKRELPTKLAGGSIALGIGFSLGREGPSIQLGALVGDAVTKVTKKTDYSRYLVTAGAAAGISAAFNAPLAGVLFCIEELHHNITPIMLTSSLISAFCADVVMNFFYGKTPVFSIHLLHILPLELYPSTILLIGIFSGIIGSIFNRLLVLFQNLYKRIIPDEFIRIVSAFFIVALTSIFFPLLSGGGERVIESIGKSGFPFIFILSILAGKILFTLFSYSSGVPGGIFMPMLAIGASVGAVANLFLSSWGIPDNYYNNYILLGMVGFFTAVVRAPITGAVLITEMGGNFSHFPAFILVSVIASIVSEIFRTSPIYDSLLKQTIPDNLMTDNPEPTVLHIPVYDGSIIANSDDVQKILPDSCILVSIERGNTEYYPRNVISISAGDILHIVVEKGMAQPLKKELLSLSGPASIDQ